MTKMGMGRVHVIAVAGMAIFVFMPKLVFVAMNMLLSHNLCE